MTRQVEVAGVVEGALDAPNPAQRDRLVEIRGTLLARIAEAER
ncbi:hypothetical protein [Streptomyces uncialis]|nr:hypothetical protein OG268_08945 [Streptomyces uncialis]